MKRLPKIPEFAHRGKITQEQKKTHEKLSRDYPYSEHNESYWINDSESPYKEDKRFDWYRPDIVGGKIHHVGPSELPPERHRF